MSELIIFPYSHFHIHLPFQEPRPLSQSDLQSVIATTTKTKVAATEYTRLNSQSASWSRHSDPDYVRGAINELSKLVASQILNLQTDDAQD